MKLRAFIISFMPTISAANSNPKFPAGAKWYVHSVQAIVPDKK